MHRQCPDRTSPPGPDSGWLTACRTAIRPRTAQTRTSTPPPTAPTALPPTDKTGTDDPLHWIAEQVADCFTYSGYAFVEEDKIDGLAAVLSSFLTVAGIPVNPPPH